MISQQVRVAKPVKLLYAESRSSLMCHIPKYYRAISTAGESFLEQQPDLRVRDLNQVAFLAALLLCELCGCPKLSWPAPLLLNSTAERVSIGVRDGRGNLTGVTVCISSAWDFSQRTVREAVTGVAPDRQIFCEGFESTGTCPEKINLKGPARITPRISILNGLSMIPAQKVGFTSAEPYFKVALDEWRQYLVVRS